MGNHLSEQIESMQWNLVATKIHEIWGGKKKCFHSRPPGGFASIRQPSVLRLRDGMDSEDQPVGRGDTKVGIIILLQEKKRIGIKTVLSKENETGTKEIEGAS